MFSDLQITVQLKNSGIRSTPKQRVGVGAGTERRVSGEPPQAAVLREAQNFCPRPQPRSDAAKTFGEKARPNVYRSQPRR